MHNLAENNGQVDLNLPFSVFHICNKTIHKLFLLPINLNNSHKLQVLARNSNMAAVPFPWEHRLRVNFEG